MTSHKFPFHWMAGALLAFCGIGAGQAMAATTEARVIDNTALYSGPGDEYPIVRYLAAGEPLTVFGCLEDYAWCDAARSGERGWVNGDLVDTYYQGNTVVLGEYVPLLGIPFVSFVFDDYWARYYIGRPWYREHGHWSHWNWRGHDHRWNHSWFHEHQRGNRGRDGQHWNNDHRARDHRERDYDGRHHDGRGRDDRNHGGAARNDGERRNLERREQRDTPPATGGRREVAPRPAETTRPPSQRREAVPQQRPRQDGGPRQPAYRGEPRTSPPMRSTGPRPSTQHVPAQRAPVHHGNTQRGNAQHGNAQRSRGEPRRAPREAAAPRTGEREQRARER